MQKVTVVYMYNEDLWTTVVVIRNRNRKRKRKRNGYLM